MNAGDKYCNNKILNQIFKIISLRKFDLLFGNLIFINYKNHPVRFWKFPIKKLDKISALKIASPTVFIKKKVLELYPYNTSYSISADTDFNLRISQVKLKFFYLNHNIIFMKTGGLSTNYKFFLLKIKFFKLNFF